MEMGTDVFCSNASHGVQYHSLSDTCTNPVEVGTRKPVRLPELIDAADLDALLSIARYALEDGVLDPGTEARVSRLLAGRD